MNTSKLFIVITLVLQFFLPFFLLGQDVKSAVDKYTGENTNYIKVNNYLDGTTMSRDKCDGIIYVQFGNSYYKRVYSGWANIKWFGAKGDGDINDLGTDDSQAIRNAISILSRISKSQKMSGGNVYGGFTIYFPSGIYLVNETFILPDGITILGESYSSTVIHTKKPRFLFSNIRGLSNNGRDVLMSTDLSIKNITLKQGGIELQGASNSTVDNVRIMNLFGDKTDTGILIKLPVNLKVRNLKIFSSTGTGILFEDTVGTGPSTTTTFDNVWISHCKIGMFINGNFGGSHGILTSRLYNSILEYNEIGLIIKGNIENFVMRDIHLEQNKIATTIDGNINMLLENVWSDKGSLEIKNTYKSSGKNNLIYLKNVNIPQNIDKSYQGKIINN